MMGSSGGGEIKRSHNQEVIQHSFFLVYYLNFKVILPSNLSTIQAHTQMPSLLWQTLDESLFNIAEFFLGVGRRWYRIFRAPQKICWIESTDRAERGLRRLPGPKASFNTKENQDAKGIQQWLFSKPQNKLIPPKANSTSPNQAPTILPPTHPPPTLSLLRNSKSYRVKTKLKLVPPLSPGKAPHSHSLGWISFSNHLMQPWYRGHPHHWDISCFKKTQH